MARQRAEERKNEHQRIQQLKGKLQNEVESLDRLYREKLQLIDQQRRNTNQISRSTYESVLVELSKNLEKKLDYQLNVGSQSRDREVHSPPFHTNPFPNSLPYRCFGKKRHTKDFFKKSMGLNGKTFCVYIPRNRRVSGRGRWVIPNCPHSEVGTRRFFTNNCSQL